MKNSWLPHTCFVGPSKANASSKAGQGPCSCLGLCKKGACSTRSRIQFTVRRASVRREVVSMVLATLNNVSLADRAKQETCPPTPTQTPWAAKVQADDKPLTNLDLINTRQEYFKPQPPQPASCFHLTPCTVPAEGLHRNQTCADPEMRPDFDCTCLLQRGWLEATSSNIGMCVLRGQRVVQDPPTTHAC